MKTESTTLSSLSIMRELRLISKHASLPYLSHAITMYTKVFSLDVNSKFIMGNPFSDERFFNHDDQTTRL